MEVLKCLGNKVKMLLSKQIFNFKEIEFMSLKELEELSLETAELSKFANVSDLEACKDCCCDLDCETYK